MDEKALVQVKKLHKDKNQKKTTFKIVISLLLLSIVVFFILTSSLFNIKKINVINNKIIKRAEIIKTSNIKKNINIFKINSLEIQEKIRVNPFIKSVDINRRLPNTIEINVVEREEAFLLQYLTMYLLVDEEGVIMEHLDSTKSNLPVIKGFNTSVTENGENIFSKDENNNLKIFINEGRKVDILSEIAEFEKDFANDINIKLNNGILVAFGTLNNVEYKLSLLKEILKDINDKDIKAKKIVMNRGSHPILILDD